MSCLRVCRAPCPVMMCGVLAAGRRQNPQAGRPRYLRPAVLSWQVSMRTLKAMQAKYHPAKLPATCDNESNPVT